MPKRWIIAGPVTSQAESGLHAYDPVVRQLLFNRGIATTEAAEAFMRAEAGFCTDPLQMTGMAAAIERIVHAVRNREPIAVYGDYDADGVTATALLVRVIRALKGDVQSYIPNRFDEGYGLNNDALAQLKTGGVQLVITVDCGIRSPDEAQYAREIGLDLIITDHHHPADGDLPQATAIINPKQQGDHYPEKFLAGVGIAYKVAEALVRQGAAGGLLESQLDLVALGTVADLAPLVGENRQLVRRGLDAIRGAQRQGLLSLARVAGMQIQKTTAGQIGFVLGPRLNAAGRLQSAEAALALLLTTDPMRSGELAQELEANNQARQALTRETQEMAEQLAIPDGKKPALLFAADERFNAGVVGLAASRLVEAHYRPAVVAQKGTEETRGSCRSIPEFHITDALDRCADILIRHGGHAAAAGFTVKNSDLPELVRRLQELAESQIGALDLQPVLQADMEMPLSAISFDLLSELEEFEPTGYGNPEAVFVSRDVKVRTHRTVGREGNHLKLTLQDERGVTTDAIGFRMGQLEKDLPSRVDLAYTLESNEYNGRTTLQLNLRDLRPAGGHVPP